jgi:methionyl-tRNA formyltransferase
LFVLDDGVDSGPIVGQKEEPIMEDDTIADLYARIEDDAVMLIKECLPDYLSGKIQPTAQDESKRRIFPQRSPADGELHPAKMTARQGYDFVRAQSAPYPRGIHANGGWEKVDN